MRARLVVVGRFAVAKPSEIPVGRFVRVGVLLPVLSVRTAD
jgi:hypothetical protein